MLCNTGGYEPLLSVDLSNGVPIERDTKGVCIGIRCGHISRIAQGLGNQALDRLKFEVTPDDTLPTRAHKG